MKKVPIDMELYDGWTPVNSALTIIGKYKEQNNCTRRQAGIAAVEAGICPDLVEDVINMMEEANGRD